MRRRLGSFALGLFVSCGGAVADDPGADAGAPRTNAADLTPDRALLATVKRIVQRSPQLAYAYENGGAVSATSHGFASSGDLAVDRHEYDKLAARIPRFADEPLEVDVARMARLRITLSPIGARHAAGALVDGRVTYRDAWPSTDLVALGNNYYTEHLFVLRDADAPRAIEYRVMLGHGLHATKDADGAIVLADAKGEGRLRITPAYAVDAAGVRRDARLTLEGSTLRIELDREGLTYPVVLDPVVESYVWEKKTTTDAPSARFYTAMSYDLDRKVMVLYGGTDVTGSRVADTWEYNGSNWTRRCGAPLPACALPIIDQHAMAYHAGLKRTFLHGFSFGTGNWLGRWDGTSWTTTTWTTSTPPISRWSQAIAYDSVRTTVIEVGGAVFAETEETLLWNGSTWATPAGPLYTAVPTCPGVAPRCRTESAMAYDSVADRVFLFGGKGPKDDTWQYNPGTKVWTEITLAGKPSARGGHGMAYDSARGRTVLFGGGTGFYDDTWEWTGTVWNPITPLTKPAGRRYFAFAYDVARGRTVLFGGSKSDGAGNAISDNETWEYHARGGGCTANSQCDTGACVDGVCCESPSCGTCQQCNGSNPGTCTTVVSGDDDTCKTPAATCNGAGVCKKLSGQTCGASTECLSGFCIDGVCCTTACGENCYACKASLKTTNADDGLCGPAKDGLDPHNNCDASGECGTSGVCDGGGTCKKQPAGKSCGAGATCDGNTAKGSQCNGSGTCNVNETGTACSPGLCISGSGCRSTCTTNADCATTAFCDTTVGQCKAKQTNGAACSAASQCTSNFCVDSVCCNSLCNEKCQACAAAAKETGADDGVCGAAKNGTNPHADCTKGSGGVCGQTGACDGAGACKIESAGLSCGAGVVCEGNTAKGQQCDGLGACVNNATGSDCKEAKCTAPSGCVSACTADGSCSSTGWCDKSVTPSICKPKKKNGDKCAVASECENPFCVDTVCCNKPCGGQCEACDTEGAVGTCVPVTGTPKNGRATCDAGSGPSDCKARSCDGITAATCAGYAGPSVVCRAAACTDNKQVGEARCDAKGACLSDPPKACDPYVCSGTACKATCAQNSDCVAPSTCDTGSGKCINAAKCDGDHTLTAPDGVTTTNCVPYRCDVSGACKTVCSSTDDCAAPALCDAGKCVQPTANPSDTEESGGCAMGAPRSTSSYAIAASLLAMLGLARRKRRASM